MEKKDGCRVPGLVILKRVAITGPESTGKSELSRKLASHYNTVYVPEYAREYIDKLNRLYTESDILVIAKGQVQAEDDRITQANGLLFCDTELLVTKIWSEVKYGRCGPWINTMMEDRPYDLFLLCAVDLPWEDDPQREHPHQRDYLFDLYHQALVQQGRNFRVIKGVGEERLANAINAVQTLFTN